MSDKKLSPLDAPTFASTLGQAVWLMTMSQGHKDLPIASIEERIAPAILLKQFKLYSKGKQPLAFLTWAAVSPDIKKRTDAGDRQLELADWRSGDTIVVMDCISPFTSPETFESRFLSDVARVQAKPIWGRRHE